MKRSSTIACPRCGSRMVLRRGPYGAFWGCSRFPDCKGTRPVRRHGGGRPKPSRQRREMEEPMDDRPWTDANEMEELPALDFSPPPAEQGIGEEHEALAQRLLGYLAFCARTTYRALGIRNVFDAGKPVIGLPRDAWDSLSAEGLRIQGKDAVDLVVTHQLSPEEYTLWAGSLFVVGKNGKRTYCAPLLLAKLQAQTGEGDEVVLVMEEGAFELNVALLGELMGNLTEEEEEAFQHRLGEIIDQIPDAPLTVESAHRFLQGIAAHLDLNLPMGGMDGFVECNLRDEADHPTLRLIPTHAWFLGREGSAFTVVQELNALANTEPGNLAGTAFVEVLLPKAADHGRPAGEPEQASADAPTPRTAPQPLFDHDFEVLPLTDAQRQAVRT
ncbi:MAG: hypothetical protein DIU76_04270, partial [Bacillota bacterium]